MSLQKTALVIKLTFAPMNGKDYKKICEECLPIIKSTGQFINDHLHQVQKSQIETKDLNSLVSYVDKQAEEQLVEGLSKIVEEAGYITEENTIEQNVKEITWIIDPLDGTSNFLHRIPHFAISVGLLVGGEIVVGIVHNVHSNECFYAWKGGGAYLNGKSIQVSTTDSVSQAVIATGFPYQVKDVAPLIRTLGYFMRHARGIRRFGAAALDLVYVACGRFDCYYETTLNAWDVAGGALIVREAGGTVCDFQGENDYLFGKSIVATNGEIGEDILQIIQKNFR